jgi:hypothetical protein
MNYVRGVTGLARWGMRLLAVTACLVLPIGGEILAAGNAPRPDTPPQQSVDAAKKADADLRRADGERLITLRRLISEEPKNAATAQLAGRTDELLLDLIAGKPTAEVNSQIETIEREVRQRVAQASVTGAVSPGALSIDERSFAIGSAVFLSLASLALSLVIYLRRRNVVEQTLRDAGLL